MAIPIAIPIAVPPHSQGGTDEEKAQESALFVVRAPKRD